MSEYQLGLDAEKDLSAGLSLRLVELSQMDYLFIHFLKSLVFGRLTTNS